MAESDPQITVIAADTHIRGEMTFDRTARVFGKFDGKVSAKGELQVAEGAACSAEVEAAKVTIDGAIEGDVTAMDRIQLNAKGRIKGDIKAAKLVVAEGATLIGHCTVGPDAAKALRSLRSKPYRSSPSNPTRRVSKPIRAYHRTDPIPAYANRSRGAAVCARMSRQTAHRTVECYHCRHRFLVGGRAMSTSCPSCHQPVIVQDVIVKNLVTTRKLQTCGRVVIKARGRVIAGVIEAQQGVEVLGALNGNVTSSGPVVIGPKGRWRGDCRAPTLQVKLGARIESGFFQIPDTGTPDPAT